MGFTQVPGMLLAAYVLPTGLGSDPKLYGQSEFAGSCLGCAGNGDGHFTDFGWFQRNVGPNLYDGEG